MDLLVLHSALPYGALIASSCHFFTLHLGCCHLECLLGIGTFISFTHYRTVLTLHPLFCLCSEWLPECIVVFKYGFAISMTGTGLLVLLWLVFAWVFHFTVVVAKNVLGCLLVCPSHSP